MRLSLAKKISFTIFGVLVLSSLSSILTIGVARHIESLHETTVAENLASVRAAEELEIALLEQRGYVSAYVLDGGNQSWLDLLDGKGRVFQEWLERARDSAQSDRENEILSRLVTVHDEYTATRREAVNLFKSGRESEAKRLLLQDVITLYNDAYDLCEDFIEANEQQVRDRTGKVRQQVRRMTAIVTASLVVAIGLGIALLWLFFYGVVFPLRKLAVEARSAAGEAPGPAAASREDELRELGRYMGVLMADVAETRSDLEQSRRQLAQSEKLAVVGKLAASVAHEIRNPLTSVKMWLYALRRSVSLDDESREKVDVVSDEINRLERIVRDFLEFSRPPQLNLTRLNVREILRRSVELVKYRIEAQDIELIQSDLSQLSVITADGEQLTQVFGNLLNNAIEAMTDGGTLRITGAQVTRDKRQMLTIRIADSGHGMPEDVQHRVFEPFFTTKPEGTGLGLSIAASVMARHRGALTLEKSNSDGTEWVVWIPITQPE